MNAPARPRVISPSGWFLVALVAACLAVPAVYILLNRNAQDAPGAETGATPDDLAAYIDPAYLNASHVPAAQTGGSVAAGERIVRNISAFGCMDPFTHDRIQSYAIAGDPLGFETALTRMTGDNRCVRFRVGEPVIALDSMLIPGMVQVRRPGESAHYWMASRELK